MKLEHYTYLLANPQKINSEDLNDLDMVVQKYPYFQSARALQLKGLKNQESFKYNEALKMAAAHTADRDILFEYITSEKFIQNEISQTILQHDSSVMEISVISEDISDKIREEKDKEWKVERAKADAILNPDLFQRKVDSVANLVTNNESNFEEKEEQFEETILADKPLEFTKSDTHSFSEWLKLTKARPIERTCHTLQKEEQPNATLEEYNTISTPPSIEEKERKFELIDKFIQDRPKITPSAFSGGSNGISPKERDKEIKNIEVEAHIQPTDSLMTETLARVYLQQKNYKKAIQAYKILILKNPEKSGFFADQIRAIEKLINPEAQ
ncbi:hypothetical protein EI546_13065 [Aequorivita sp. H23M31]|uniref:Tetratricopeptide repeat protein n=1 Tax=Aequorivita ciconiae TaxID=2494375 RepID=A0A410G5P0_9FLAO|nr:hypothetical protein [Aequorivita sp. H23M31]QAA82592.1 hypothetical protein EI546_13065 [Aequorivita sp. H23M31]